MYTFILLLMDGSSSEAAPFQMSWAHRKCILDFGHCVYYAVNLQFILLMLFSSRFFVGIYVAHYGDSEREGRLLPGSAQRFRWQVSLEVLCAIINIALKTLDTEIGLRNSWLLFFFFYCKHISFNDSSKIKHQVNKSGKRPILLTCLTSA